MCYQLRYRERNNRVSGSDPWSERQIGVYHHFSNDGLKPSTMIMLHAKQETVARTRVHNAAESVQVDTCGAKLSLRMHLLIFSSYVDNWRWYLDSIGTTLLREVSEHV